MNYCTNQSHLYVGGHDNDVKAAADRILQSRLWMSF